ncbi:QueT transporter family protein [Aerococcaceae bacterium 50-4]
MHNANDTITPSRFSTLDMTKIAVVAALYVVITLLIAPIAFGPIQFRISESLNFLALHNKRYIWAVSIGVFIANFMTYGPIDMIVGSVSTFIFLYLGRWLGDQLVKMVKQTHFTLFSDQWIRYITLTVVFALSMFTTTTTIILVGAEAAFWPTYISLALSEFAAMTLGMFIMYPLSKRIDFDR